MEDKSAKLNGYRIRSWGDLVAVASLLAMLMASVAWGLKLESELNKVRDDLSVIQSRVADGILPRAEERIERHNGELNDVRRRLDNLEDKH